MVSVLSNPLEVMAALPLDGLRPEEDYSYSDLPFPWNRSYLFGKNDPNQTETKPNQTISIRLNCDSV